MAPKAKAKKAAARPTSAARVAQGKSAASSEIAMLEAECQELRVELEAARQVIARLQKRQELVVNRIDWVIDSLHNLLEDGG
ncbi:MAG TPA: hypothetical protein P5114_00755 [Hyphomicrobiaceae bacterium]|nr:hypothetical protein [Hyphomicrobiaceae bacterium]